MRLKRKFLRVAVAAVSTLAFVQQAAAELHAGAASVDITPVELPVIVNGGFLERTTDQVTDRLHARGLVLGDGEQTICIVVADSCMIPRDICDRIKTIAEAKTGIAANRMLIAATHTHSAPSLMSYCLGSRRDEAYTQHFVTQVAECIAQAQARMRPAEAGWTVVDAPNHTYCRRWIRRPDRVDSDPFGKSSVRAMMHPGHQNTDYLGPAGPVDAGLTVLSLRAIGGEPICVLANYSMHYVGGAAGISADYWGHFDRLLGAAVRSLRAVQPKHSFVVMMSQGTSGDLHWMDYARPRRPTTPEGYATELSEIVLAQYREISYSVDIDLAMSETRLTMDRRAPNAARLNWARKINEQRGDRRPQNRAEVYAEQAAWIREHPEEQIVLQAIRIGQLGITAIPNEVFGITGLKLKAQSPLPITMNMELANGAAGYIPPPEQHALGGYTTWPARTAGLEVEAEPKIVLRLLELLETVSGRPRRTLTHDLYTPTMRANMRQALSSGE